MAKQRIKRTRKYRKSKVKNCPTCGRYWKK